MKHPRGEERSPSPARAERRTSVRDSPPLVTGGEALRLKEFLTQHDVRLPRVFYRTAQTPIEAAEEHVSERLLVRTLEAAMRAVRRPSLPIDFGATIRSIDMGIYGIAIQTAPTVAEALDRSVRFQRLMTTTARIYLEREEGGLRWVWSCPGPRTLGARVRNEAVLAEHVAVFRFIVPNAHPRVVSFMHAAPSDIKAHRRFFGCSIRWSADEDSVGWDSEQLTRPVHVDATLSAFIHREAERRLSLLPASGSLDEVKDVILRRLPTGDADLATVAAVLGRAPRTLRRDLARGDTSFRALLDEVRRERAVALARGGKSSMTAIAERLGFSEVSALSRAWRRWFRGSFRASRG